MDAAPMQSGVQQAQYQLSTPAAGELRLAFVLLQSLKSREH